MTQLLIDFQLSLTQDQFLKFKKLHEKLQRKGSMGELLLFCLNSKCDEMLEAPEIIDVTLEPTTPELISGTKEKDNSEKTDESRAI